MLVCVCVCLLLQLPGVQVFIATCIFFFFFFFFAISHRVMNVFRHWVEQHIYDFDKAMEATLRGFLDELRGKQRMRKWAESIERLLDRRGVSLCGFSDLCMCWCVL